MHERGGGYRPRDRETNGGGDRRKPQKPQRKTIEALPDPEILEAYDCILEGSAKTILDMFEREQKHRHAWEQRALKIHSQSTVLGQVLGFLIALSVFASAALIGMYGDKTVAATIWVFGLALVLMTGLIWSYARTVGQRPLFARPAMRQHFRPEKEKEEKE